MRYNFIKIFFSFFSKLKKGGLNTKNTKQRNCILIKLQSHFFPFSFFGFSNEYSIDPVFIFQYTCLLPVRSKLQLAFAQSIVINYIQLSAIINNYIPKWTNMQNHSNTLLLLYLCMCILVLISKLNYYMHFLKWKSYYIDLY